MMKFADDLSVDLWYITMGVYSQIVIWHKSKSYEVTLQIARIIDKSPEMPQLKGVNQQPLQTVATFF